MKKIIPIILVLFLCFSCGETSNKKENKIPETVSLDKDQNASFESSSDYSTLLTEYKCEMGIKEVAEILKVPESDLSIPEYAMAGKCSFNLKSFGENNSGNGTGLVWGPSQSSKSQNKKDIESYLEKKKNNELLLGMDISLAETSDSYIAYQPAHGRVIIYNENYDKAFLINYGRRSANTDRTQKQHEELRLKMTDLANYLLKKHKK